MRDILATNTGVQFLAGAGIFLFATTLTSFGTHPASCLVNTGGSFLGSEADAA